MLSTAGRDVGGGLKRRKPLQLLTGIFTRKNRRGGGGEDAEDGEEVEEEAEVVGESVGDKLVFLPIHDMWRDDEDDLSPEIPGPREALHSPYHSRTIDQDMETLRLSRQDNPFLQVLASQEDLNESVESCEYEEEKRLMSKENLSGRERDPLTIEQVHARLVRSPPPVMWTRSRNSEPSFARFTSCDSKEKESVFQFPSVNSDPHSPTPTHYSTSSIPNVGHHHHHHHGHQRLLSPFDFSSRMKDSALESISGKFNLSPQPRRRPETKVKAFS